MSIIQRLREKILIFGSNGINKDIFEKSSHRISVNNVHINKIVMSDKGLYVKKSSFQYFIGYKSNNDIRSLIVTLCQVSGYVKYFDVTKVISFLTKDKNLPDVYNAIWSKGSTKIKKSKTKTESYNGKINTNFHSNKTPQSVPCVCLSVISLSILREMQNM